MNPSVTPPGRIGSGCRHHGRRSLTFIGTSYPTHPQQGESPMNETAHLAPPEVPEPKALTEPVE